jgi:hypothetical protein
LEKISNYKCHINLFFNKCYKVKSWIKSKKLKKNHGIKTNLKQ